MASRNNKQFRKRRDDSSDDDSEGGAKAGAPPPAKRPAIVNAFGATTTKPLPTASDDKGPTDSFVHSYVSGRTSASHQYGGGAFATSEIDTAADRDGRALLERKTALQQEAAAAVASGTMDLSKPREYKGMAGYTTFTAPKDATEAVASSKITGTMGPLRAPTNVRGICRIDYQPDICKDYKETGYCTFGDSCKFLHDRSDYKAGWQVENEWQEQQKKKKLELQKKLSRAVAGDAEAGDDEDGEEQKKDDDGLPFACFICRHPFALSAPPAPREGEPKPASVALNPVVTQCGHYFCERCAVARHSDAANPDAAKCAVCARPTQGIFNTAAKLVAKLKRLQGMNEAGLLLSKGAEAKEGAAAGDEEGDSGGWV